jgi:hypothetical protein
VQDEKQGEIMTGLSRTAGKGETVNGQSFDIFNQAPEIERKNHN